MPGLMDLMGRLKDAAATAGHNLMPDPQGMGSLLSPEDISGARSSGLIGLGTGLLASHGAGFAPLADGLNNAQSAYNSRLATVAGQKEAGQQHEMQNTAMARNNDMLRQRANIANQFAPQPGETEAERIQKLPQMMSAYLQAGDFESAKILEPIITKMADDKKNADKLQAVQAGDAIYTFDPAKGTYTRGPERHENADVIKDKAEEHALRMAGLAESRARLTNSIDEHNDSLAAANSRSFQTHNADLTKSAQAYSTFNAAMDDARAGNPAALKSAIINFAGNADSKAQLRQGILNYVSKVDPSWKGTADMAIARVTSGTLPPQTLAYMQHLVDKIHAANRGLYDRRRAAEVGRNPRNEVIPTTEEIFGTGPSAAAPSRDMTMFMGGKH